jgi:hypothetical protein
VGVKVADGVLGSDLIVKVASAIDGFSGVVQATKKARKINIERRVIFFMIYAFQIIQFNCLFIINVIKICIFPYAWFKLEIIS